jgi:hypothetical protein
VNFGTDSKRFHSCDTEDEEEEEEEEEATGVAACAANAQRRPLTGNTITLVVTILSLFCWMRTFLPSSPQSTSRKRQKQKLSCDKGCM